MEAADDVLSDAVAEKSLVGELQRFSNGNTAINVRADAEDIDGAAIGVYLNARRERVWRYS